MHLDNIVFIYLIFKNYLENIKTDRANSYWKIGEEVLNNYQ